MPTWNEEQLKAIYTKDKNVLVSASAGAGKTTVLIARLVELVINNRIKIDHILAMTFTEAAANEMKKRLRQSFTAYISKAMMKQRSNISVNSLRHFPMPIFQRFTPFVCRSFRNFIIYPI